MNDGTQRPFWALWRWTLLRLLLIVLCAGVWYLLKTNGVTARDLLLTFNVGIPVVATLPLGLIAWLPFVLNIPEPFGAVGETIPYEWAGQVFVYTVVFWSILILANDLLLRLVLRLYRAGSRLPTAPSGVTSI